MVVGVERGLPVRGGPEGRGRLLFLDNLKVVLVAAVIVAHAAMTYGAAGSWVYEAGDYGAAPLSAVAEGVLSLLIAVGAMFGIGLFMLASGLVTPGAVARRGRRAFAVGRLVRLGIPIALYVVLIMPLLGVFIESSAVGGTGPIGAVYLRRLGWLSTGPLWFVVILLAISFGYVIWRSVVPPHTGVGQNPLSGRLLVTAALIIAGASFGIRVVWPVDSSQYLDAHVWLWPQCAVLFGLGALTGERGRRQPTSARLQRQWTVAAGVALVTVVAALGLAAPDEDAVLGGLHWESLVLSMFEGVFAIGMSLWALSLFEHHFDEQHRVMRELARAAYGAFVIQAPVLVCLALGMRRLVLAAEAQFLMLAAGALAISFGLSWLVVTVGSNMWRNR